MLNTLEAITNRRSIRKFKPDPVPNEKLETILEAARMAPSPGNTQPWKFLLIEDKETKADLRRICWNQSFIEEAPLVIVCFGDLKRYVQIGNSQGRYNNYMPSDAAQDQINFVTASVGIAMEHISIMAAALGLGTTLVGGFGDASEFNRLFGLDRSLVPVGVIPVGYPAELPPQRPRLSLQNLLVQKPLKGTMVIIK